MKQHIEEPQCVEVSIEASVGGKVQIVKFALSNEFTFNYSERYTIPTDWSDERREEWTNQKIADIKEKIDGLAQVEQDALLEQSDWYR